MNKTLIYVGIIILGLGLGGLAIYMAVDSKNSTIDYSSSARTPSPTIIPETVSTESGQKNVSNEDRPIGGMSADDHIFEGELLAGNTSKYYAFTQSDYEKMLTSDKIIFLEFYADWCPICRVEQPDIEEGFDKLTYDDVVGFRVNYKDDETDDAESALAKKFGITYQHTKVVLVDGKEIVRSGEPWSTPRFIEVLNEIVYKEEK